MKAGEHEGKGEGNVGEERGWDLRKAFERRVEDKEEGENEGKE